MTSKIRLMTDSTCDIPRDLAARWQIGMVPAFVNYDGQSFADDERHLDRRHFYEQMPALKPPPTTAAPPSGLSEQVARDTLADADHLIVLTAPAALSGIYNSVRLGLSVLPAGKTTLIDSGSVSMGLGLQVLIGAEVAAATGDVAQTLDALERLRSHVRVYAALRSLEHLRRSGRVGWARASVGELLQIKPLVSVVEGVVHQVAQVRTFARATDKLVELTRAEAPLDRLAVLHTNNPAGAEALLAALVDVAPPDTVVVMANTALGVHIGPGALGVAMIKANWRQA